MLIDIMQIWELCFGTQNEEQLSLLQQRGNFIQKKGKTVLGRKNISTKVKNTKNLDYPKNGEAFGVARVSLMRNEERGVEYDQES